MYLYTMEAITINTLKDNKAEIISIITEKCGAENVKAVMTEMINGLSCCDTLEQLIEDAIYMALEFEVKIEKSKLASILGKLEQLELEETI